MAVSVATSFEATSAWGVRVVVVVGATVVTVVGTAVLLVVVSERPMATGSSFEQAPSARAAQAAATSRRIIGNATGRYGGRRDPQVPDPDVRLPDERPRLRAPGRT